MGKSVIKSLIFGALSVMLISFLIVTIVFFYGVKENAESDVYDDMKSCMENLKPVAQLSVDFSTSKMHRLFDAAMRQFTGITEYRFVICTQSGDIVWSDLEKNPSDIELHIKRVTNTFGKGKSIRFKGILDKLYATQTMTYGEKIQTSYSGENLIILCTARVPDFSGRFFDVLLELLVMEIAALFFMAIFLYLFSRSITSPLSKINKTIKEFSKGDFDKRVEYKSENELGELAGNINAMAESIQNLETMRTAFVSDVSHELRTPTTSISGFVEGILDGTIPPEDSDKYLQIVLSESKRLSRLVDDLLRVSRIDSRKEELNKQPFDITELARIVLLKFESDITQKNIDVSFESDGEEVFVLAEKDSMTQILINLIHNAVKFTPQNGYIKITINTNETKCFVSVENNGPGISSYKLNLIWERFYKTDSSRSSDKSGVGLGLYIVKRLIDSHGESITVTSEPDKKTIFKFSIDLS